MIQAFCPLLSPALASLELSTGVILLYWGGKLRAGLLRAWPMVVVRADLYLPQLNPAASRTGPRVPDFKNQVGDIE